jgi:hypothetical protein
LTDKKISQFNELIAVVDEDLLVIVDAPSGAAETKKITRGNLIGANNIVMASGKTISLVNPIEEFSTDGTMAGARTTAVPTESAVVEYVAAHAGGTNVATRQLDNIGTVAINQSLIAGTDNTIHLGSADKRWGNGYFGGTVLSEQGTMAYGTITNLNMGSGTFSQVRLVNTINEFSTDATMAGNSNTAVPTEAAVVTYVANNAGSPAIPLMLMGG